MNIVLISGKHPIKAKSGYARYTAALARILTQLRLTVHIFCVGETASVKSSPIGTIHVIHVPFIQLFSGRDMIGLLPFSILLAQAIHTFLRLHPHDTLLWGIGPWSLAGAWMKKKHPSIIFFADYFTTIRHETTIPLVKPLVAVLYSPLEKYLLTTCDRILTHYLSSEKILTNEFGILTHKLYRMPYTIDIPRRPKIHRASSPPQLLTICRQDYRKGISSLLHAYALLEKQNIPFKAIIIGSGQAYTSNKRLAKRLKLTNVTFMGSIEHIHPKLAHAFCFVLPSLEEGGGSIAILEAMAAGLPIIATNVDGIGEDVTNGKSGILVPPADPYTIAKNIEHLVMHPHIAKQMGRNATLAFNQKYATKKVKIAITSLLTSYGMTQ